MLVMMMMVMTIIVMATSSASTNTIATVTGDDACWTSDAKGSTFVDKVMLLLLGR